MPLPQAQVPEASQDTAPGPHTPQPNVSAQARPTLGAGAEQTQLPSEQPAVPVKPAGLQSTGVALHAPGEPVSSLQ